MKNKRIIFEITHPKHYHQFKYIIAELEKDNKILVLARNKDVVLDLLEYLDTEKYIYNEFGKNLFVKILLIPKLLFKYIRLFIRFNPDIVISRSSAYSAFACKFFRCKSVIFPDSEVVMLTRKFVAPLSDLIITPENYRIDYGMKHYRLNGFFEESYLNPKYFKTNEDIVKLELADSKEKFFFLRFVSWQANHDVNQFGFTREQKRILINYLAKFGRILISSEKKLEVEFEKYSIRIQPAHVHHILSKAWLYVGDSQSMATEAALLGTPSLRYNSFVGPNDMSNFIILEKKYDLMRNFGDFDHLMETIESMLENQNLKEEWLLKRKQYFSSKPDLNEQMIKAIF